MLLRIPVQCKKRVRVFAWFIYATSVSLHSRNYEGNGYKLLVQRFLGSFGWTNVSYDWLMVFKATINQSYETLVHPTDPRNHCAESLYSFPLQFLEQEIRRRRERRAVFGVSCRRHIGKRIDPKSNVDLIGSHRRAAQESKFQFVFGPQLHKKTTTTTTKRETNFHRTCF